MNYAAVDRIARTVLYEGYVLYPYRPSSAKNRHRFTFGALFPKAFADRNGEPSSLQTEVLVEGAAPAVDASVRFLHLVERDGWQQAVEREISLRLPGTAPFAFAPQPGQVEVCGSITISAARCAADLLRLTVHVSNGGECDPLAPRDAALLHALVSAHVVLGVSGGAFVSLLDPPKHARAAAAACCNRGVFPVLVGADTMLASPIILYDHPRIAPESPGDLFDATEIDEILSLRILTLTQAEKREARAADPKTRDLIDRTERLGGAELMRLHGALRSGLAPGARVRIKPRAGSDVLDLALAGRDATVASIEQDYDGRLYVIVTVDDDPGKDLGPFGHRFFFRPEEVEPLP
jgi:hypothetical protein